MPLTLDPRTTLNAAPARRSRRLSGAGMLAAALLLAACGNGDDTAPEGEDVADDAGEGTSATGDEAADGEAADEAPSEDPADGEDAPSNGTVTATYRGEPLSFDTVECAMRGLVFTVFGEGDDRVEFKFETAEDSDVAETLDAIMLIPEYDDELSDSQLQIYQVVGGDGAAALADLAEGGEAPQGSGTIDLQGLPGTEADPDGGTLEFDFSC